MVSKLFFVRFVGAISHIVCLISILSASEIQPAAEPEPTTMMEWLRARKAKNANVEQLVEPRVAPQKEADPQSVMSAEPNPVARMENPFRSVTSVPAVVVPVVQTANLEKSPMAVAAASDEVAPIISNQALILPKNPESVVVRSEEKPAKPPIQVMTTVPILATLFEIIGGDQVSVKSYTNPFEDLSVVEPQLRPRRELDEFLVQADVFAQAGTQVEAKWVQDLLFKMQGPPDAGKKRNYFTAFPIQTLSQDVSKIGNAHYLADPLNGIQVARSIQDLLTKLRPEDEANFQKRYNQFHRELGIALVGEPVYNQYSFEMILNLYQTNQLPAFLDHHNLAYQLGGWLKIMLPHRGKKVFMDEGNLAYFEKRFGLDPDESLSEFDPAQEADFFKRTLVFSRMQVGAKKKIVVTHENRESGFVRKLKAAPEAKIVQLAAQVHTHSEANDYVTFVDQNVKALDDALKN